MEIFSSMVVCSWPSIFVNRAAIGAWHSAAGVPGWVTEDSSDVARRFWKGFRKLADHRAVRTKAPLSQDALGRYIDARLAAPPLVGTRDAAIAATAFYGVRRISEVLGLSRSAVTFEEDHATAFVARQKNDQLGRGIRCWVPRMPQLGHRCPLRLLRGWRNAWDAH